jgi:hypothetical protein
MCPHEWIQESFQGVIVQPTLDIESFGRSIQSQTKVWILPKRLLADWKVTQSIADTAPHHSSHKRNNLRSQASQDDDGRS